MNDVHGKAFKMSQTCFDSASKELVRISNGTEDPQNGFGPTEAIALRVVGYRKTKRGLYPRVAFTYRKVDPKTLTVCEGDPGRTFEGYFAATSDGELQPKYRAGRV